MRIYGNRQIKTLPGKKTRPTTARVREALFNIWLGRIEGCRWLDLCAGSGSMGAEALCRGAATVTGIEKNPRACAIIKENWQRVVGEGKTFTILCSELVKQLQSMENQEFDRIYFDPPYNSDLYGPVLEAIAGAGLLASGGEIAVEGRRSLWVPLSIPGLEICREKVYGHTVLVFYYTI